MVMLVGPAFDPRSIPSGLTIRPWRAPDGWEHRAFEWAPAPDVPTRGSLLYQGGRADFIEKHLEAFHDWHALGWQVSGFDWRGQGGSGRFLPDRNVCHAASLDPHVEDAAAHVREWIGRSPRPHAVVAHSMGAHIILRMLAESGVTPDAVVLLAPMLGINTTPLPHWLARRLVAAMRHLGRGSRPVWREGKGMATGRLRQKMLTSSVERFEDGSWWKRNNPQLTVGGPTWDWIAAALASQRRLDAPGTLERIGTPILILAARDDRLVSHAAIERAAPRLPAATLRSFHGGHDLLREADPLRTEIMSAIGRFFDEHAPRQ